MEPRRSASIASRERAGASRWRASPPIGRSRSGAGSARSGICAGLGVSGEVLSPSFVLAEEYAGIFPVFHFDLYRLESVDEVARIGLFDAIDDRNVVIVEWGDRLPAGSFDADVRIVMEITGERSRALTIEGRDGFLDALEGSIA
jgi:tRNA threonylcarbamoyladenosine biosynthesis protein TsaE